MKRLREQVAGISALHALGRVTAVHGQLVEIGGLETSVRIGDRLRLWRTGGAPVEGEVLRLDRNRIIMLPDEVPRQVALADRVSVLGPALIAPDESWFGRIVDPYGRPLDGCPLTRGPRPLDVVSAPPDLATRKPLGERLSTGLNILNTFLPIARGQRVGVFAGSGVGKSMLLGTLARHLAADVVVLALVGERSREIGEFTRDVLGPEGMARSIVVAASADQAPTARLRCPLAAMRIAESFRDCGAHVLLVIDSVTRFAEAHREVAIASGEMPALRGFPASTPSRVMEFVERAGPGAEGRGDITGVFSVLVAGSDMDEPVADLMRGVLDGHLVLERSLAEKGRFPAIDVLQSVSRALPKVATAPENGALQTARRLISVHEDAAALLKSGLYSAGTDEVLDQAVRFAAEIESFLTGAAPSGVSASFDHLRLALRRTGVSLEQPSAS